MTEVITVGEYKLKASEHKLQVLVLDIIAAHRAHPDIIAFASANAGLRSAHMGAQ
jgi:hypothetical protein